jgi:hypothetical protein
MARTATFAVIALSSRRRYTINGILWLAVMDAGSTRSPGPARRAADVLDAGRVIAHMCYHIATYQHAAEDHDPRSAVNGRGT